MARNTVSGQVAPVRESLLNHPHFKDQLELVDEDAKSYVEGLYKPGTVEEKKAHRSGRTHSSKTTDTDTGKAE